MLEIVRPLRHATCEVEGIALIVYKSFLVCLRRGIGVSLVALLSSRPILGHPLPCDGETDYSAIARSLMRIRASIDPCGESPRVLAMLDRIEHCARTSYRVCTDRETDRNFFDRPLGNAALVRTITWNPELLTAIEPGCDGDPAKPVLRDPTASLLHELAHAAQDCDGLDPTAYEFDAVRIENIYRRAKGMCQRTKYGAEPLPPQMTKTCQPGDCPCTSPVDVNTSARQMVGNRHSATLGAPRARMATSGDAQPGRAAR